MSTVHQITIQNVNLFAVQGTARLVTVVEGHGLKHYLRCDKGVDIEVTPEQVVSMLAMRDAARGNAVEQGQAVG